MKELFLDTVVIPDACLSWNHGLTLNREKNMVQTILSPQVVKYTAFDPTGSKHRV